MHKTGLSILTNSSVFGVFIYQEDGKIVFTNKRFLEILGYTEPEVLGKSILEFIPKEYVKIKEIKDILSKRLKGERFAVELKEHFFISKTKALVPVSVFAYTVEYNDKPSGFVLVLDRTKEVVSEKLFFALSQINQLIVRAQSKEELLRQACDILVDKVGYTACAVGYIDESTKLFVQKYTRAKTKEIEETLKSKKIGTDVNTPYGRGSVSRAYHTSKIAIVENIDKIKETSYWHDYFKRFNIHSACSIPILKDGKIDHIVLINDSTLASFSKDYIYLLEELSLDLSFAIGQIELKKYTDLLYQAIASSHEWVVITDKQGNIEYTNKAVSDISGYDARELIGKNPRIFKSGYHKKEFYENLWSKILSGKSCQCRFTNKAKDGSIFFLDSIIMPIMHDGQIQRFVDISRDVTKQVTQEQTLELTSKIYNTLYEITNLSITVKSKEEFLKQILPILISYLNMQAGFIVDSNLNINHYYPKDTKYSYLIDSLNLKELQNKDLPIKKAMIKKRIYIVNNLDQTPCHFDCPFRTYIKAHSLKSRCVMPLVEDKKAIGALVLLSSTKGIFNEQIYKLLNTLSNQIAFILSRFKEQTFFEMTQLALNSSFEFVVIIDEYFNIVYVNEKALEVSGYSKDELLGKHYSIFLSKTYTKELPSAVYYTLTSGTIYSNFIKYKIKSGDVRDFFVNIFPFKKNGKITHYVAIGKLIDEKEAIKQLEDVLYKDPVTNLPNYHAFIQYLERYLERAPHESFVGALAIINPISFSSVNQAFGFETGNQLLRIIADRLKGSIYQYDILAKLESDRFGLIIKDLKTEEDILIVVSKLLSVINKPYTVGEKSIFISFNIGLSIIPKDGTSPKELLNKANIALMDAKEKGENQIGFFRKDLEEKAYAKLKLKSDLERAVLNKEFICYYQPIVDKHKNIIAAEALMRWKKDNAIVPPMQFIEYLEQINLIVDAEEQVIETVLKDLRLLKSKNKQIPISINLSVLSLKARSLPQTLKSNLNYFDIDASLLKIEIIERTFLKDFEYIKNLIEELASFGVYFSIDDFGTQYSSLNYLARLNVSYLKIDICFVREITTNQKVKAIVGSIINLAKSLNIQTIAEGVETKEQFEILQSLNCDYFQGYLFYKPVALEELINIL